MSAIVLATIVQPVHYKRVRRRNNPHQIQKCHPMAPSHWSAIDVCPEPDPTFINEQLSSSFKCAVCMDIITNPVNVACSGGHIFCKICIQRTARSVLTRSQSIPCPSCRELFTLSDIRDDNFAKRMIGDLMVKCINHQITEKTAVLFKTRTIYISNPQRARRAVREPIKESARDRSRSRSRERNNNEQEEEHKQHENISTCEWVGEYRNLSHHLAVCPLNIVPCKRCGLPLLRNEIHSHPAQCPWLPLYCDRCNEHYVKCEAHLCPLEVILCPWKCGQQFERNREKVHWDNCPKVRISCEYSDYGCDELVPRENMDQHSEECVAIHLSMMKETCDELKVLQEEHNELSGDYEEALESIQCLEEKCEELQQDHEDLQQDHEELHQDHTDLAEQCEALQESHEELHEKVDKMQRQTNLLWDRVFAGR